MYMNQQQVLQVSKQVMKYIQDIYIHDDENK